MFQRVREHELLVAKQEDNKSLTKQTKETGQIFDFKNAKILARTNNKGTVTRAFCPGSTHTIEKSIEFNTQAAMKLVART